jgi:hypothetical protein
MASRLATRAGRLAAVSALSAASSFFAVPALADNVFVDRATGSGVAESDLDTATTLVKTSVADVGGETVVDRIDKADLVLRPTLMRLGESYVLGLAKLREGKIAGSSQLKAARMDELDKVADRLTRSVLAGENAKANPRVGEITQHEASEGTERRPTRSENYLSFGGSVLSNLNSTGLGYSFGVGHAWDANIALLKIYAQGDFNGDAWMLTGGIGGDYFFSTRDIAPYVTADFGGGAAKIDGGGVFTGQTVGGFAVGVGGGVQFLRTASVNLDLGFRAGYVLHSNSIGLPQCYSLRLGLYF